MKIKRLLSSLLAVIMILGVNNFSSSFIAHADEIDHINIIESDDMSTKYSSYKDKLCGYTAEEIKLIEEEITVKSGNRLSYTFEAKENADYEIVLEYVLTSRNDLEIELLIDGKLPFQEAEQLIFQGQWKNGTARYDGVGNEISPEQLLVKSFYQASAIDRTGEHNNPYKLFITKGNHTIDLNVKSGEAKLKCIKLMAPEKVEAYSNPIEQKNNEEIITLEGETADLKSTYSLIPMTDGSSAQISPCDPIKSKLNYIGGSNWKNSGDTIIWKFNVEKEGYYSFGAFYRQNINLGAISYRHLKIDGKTPFVEAEKLKFKYSASWDYFLFGEEKPYLFWLDKGEHTLSLSVTSGEMSEVYSDLKEATAVMGDLYIDITMLVGETVDTYRSYELFNQIPNYNERMNYILKVLNNISKKIEVLQEKSSGSMISTLGGAIEILEKMLDQPYSAHKYKTAFYNSYTNLGALLGTIVEMPLDIDRVFLIGDGAGLPDTDISFFEKLSFDLKRFFITFTSDYDNISATNDSENTLDLWVNWGRDQAQVLTALINEDFTPKHNINVNVKVVNATLIQGILAGKGPDVMLHMARTEPVNLAMRGALVDLEQFDDFDDVLRDFSNDAIVPYQYGGGTYALPDTLTYDMLFIRTDIFEDLEIEVPDTWEKFSEVATTIQRSNLQVYMPSSLYTTFLSQNNLPLYDMEQGISTLVGAEQIQCFIEYTDWFTKYKLPKKMDSFFNRFRIGSVPMGIANYTLITQLEVAAPEIANRWTVAKLPATIDEKGNKNYTSAAGGTGCAITRLSDNPEDSWEFLKWWVSADVQTSYSNNLESLLGPLGRVSTASNSAFEKLGWSEELMPVLLEQKENTINLAQLPGGYYVDRGIEQAYWNVVEQNANPTDVMLKWGNIVNEEMRRKKAEYN